MAKYETRAATIGDITVTVSRAGKTAAEKVQALLEFLGDRLVDPDYGVGGDRPSQGLPPSPGHPDQGLPPVPGRPDQGLPPGASTKPTPGPGAPDQSLPGGNLGNFLKDHAKEIAAIVLKGTICDPAKPQPK